jgi:hypothetical protein
MSLYNFGNPKAEVESKPFYKSKTIWVNALTLLAGTVGFWAGHELIANNTALIAGLVAFQGLVNTVLRFVSWKKIG